MAFSYIYGNMIENMHYLRAGNMKEQVFLCLIWLRILSVM